MTERPQHEEVAVRTPADALAALRQAWPAFVSECRAVLGSELHYQAALYHCLRAHGGVPRAQLGMNVKVWVSDVISVRFRELDVRKHPDYRGGFEPIPDVVIFRPEIAGDFRRRNQENTLRQMLLAVEVKASEREGKRLRPKEIIDDVLKLEALGIEARHRGSEALGAVVVVDTAPDANERMTLEARRVATSAARERGVCLFYLSPSEESLVLRYLP